MSLFLYILFCSFSLLFCYSLCDQTKILFIFVISYSFALRHVVHPTHVGIKSREKPFRPRLMTQVRAASQVKLYKNAIYD